MKRSTKATWIVASVVVSLGVTSSLASAGTGYEPCVGSWTSDPSSHDYDGHNVRPDGTKIDCVVPKPTTTQPKPTTTAPKPTTTVVVTVPSTVPVTIPVTVPVTVPVVVIPPAVVTAPATVPTVIVPPIVVTVPVTVPKAGLPATM